MGEHGYEDELGADGFRKLIADACPYGQSGDRLWVREAWAHTHDSVEACRAEFEDALGPGMNGPFYRATDEAPYTLRWRPSIHMPRWASRITLEVTGVRVERVQDITQEDCLAEGIAQWEEGYELTAQEVFRKGWNALNMKRGFGWDTNPWVWVVSFRRLAA